MRWYTSRKSVKLLILLTMVLATAGLSCSGSHQTPAIPDAPDPHTRAALSGPLCNEKSCECTDDPAKIGVAGEGLKRFRVELGPSESQIWATIGKNVFYKGIERAEACFYVDLRTGELPISMRAKGEAGFGARFRISEVGGEGPWLYQSFDFNCGAPGLCDMASLRDWKESVKGVSAGKHAPCGSVRILGIDWTTGRMPDNLHPADFLLEGQMKIYKFLPRHAPGTEECVKE